jgi:hypothetical protein
VAYDEELANRIREALQGQAGVSEKRMFGGLAFLVNGHLAVSASRQGGLLLRIDPARGQALVTSRHAAPFVMRGHELDGWLRIDPAGLTTQRALARWVGLGVDYARSLPPR